MARVENIRPLVQFEHDIRFTQFILAQARERLLGRENHTKRPSIGFKLMIDGCMEAVVKPQLKSSSTGWELSGVVEVKVKISSDGKVRFMDYQLHSDGSVVAKRWYKNEALTLAFKETLLALINMAAENPLTIISASISDHCGICGKGLSDELSISLGIGPECIKGFYKVFVMTSSSVTEDAKEDDFPSMIKTLRKALQQAHPDKGGDAAKFIALKSELDKLKAVIQARKAA